MWSIGSTTRLRGVAILESLTLVSMGVIARLPRW
jgi:hypothetical protein